MSQALADSRQRELAPAHSVCVHTLLSCSSLAPITAPRQERNPQAAFPKGLGDPRKESTGLSLHIQENKNKKIKKSQPQKKKIPVFCSPGQGAASLPPCHSPSLRFEKTQTEVGTADTAPWMPSEKISLPFLNI